MSRAEPRPKEAVRHPSEQPEQPSHVFSLTQPRIPSFPPRQQKHSSRRQATNACNTIGKKVYRVRCCEMLQMCRKKRECATCCADQSNERHGAGVCE